MIRPVPLSATTAVPTKYCSCCSPGNCLMATTEIIPHTCSYYPEQQPVKPHTLNPIASCPVAGNVTSSHLGLAQRERYWYVYHIEHPHLCGIQKTRLPDLVALIIRIQPCGVLNSPVVVTALSVLGSFWPEACLMQSRYPDEKNIIHTLKDHACDFKVLIRRLFNERHNQSESCPKQIPNKLLTPTKWPQLPRPPPASAEPHRSDTGTHTINVHT